MPAAGAIISAVGSLAGGKMQGDAAANAAGAQMQGGRDAINAQLAMYNQSRADTLPYQTTGVGALNMLAGIYGLPTFQGGVNTGQITVSGGEPAAKKKRSFFDKVTDPANLAGQFGGTSYDPMGFFSSGGGGGTTPLQFNIADGGGGTAGQQGNMLAGTGSPDFSAFMMSPDYLVARDEGLKGVNRAAAARGNLGAGGTSADLMTLASNLGTQQFGNFTNNLFRLAGIGGSANQQLNQLGQNTGNQVAQGFSNIGDARASSYINQANAQGNALGGLANSAGQFFGQRGFGSAPAANAGVYNAAPSVGFASGFGNNTNWLTGTGG